jgi:molecular chaperone DnaJ
LPLLILLTLFSFSAAPSEPPKSTDDSHKNEGFLKSAWHRLTHQHDSNPEKKDAEPKQQQEASNQDEEPKKASGSG